MSSYRINFQLDEFLKLYYHKVDNAGRMMIIRCQLAILSMR